MTGIAANLFQNFGNPAEALQGRNSPWRAASGLGQVGSSERPRQEEEERIAGSVKIVSPREKGRPFCTNTAAWHMTPYAVQIYLHFLNIQIAQVVVLAKRTV